MALALRERVELSTEQRFRLVGIGLSNFREPEATQAPCSLNERYLAIEAKGSKSTAKVVD